MKTSEIDTLAAETCAYMSQKHPDFSILAARIAVSNLHKNTSESFFETCRLLHDYEDEQGRAASLLAEDVYNFIEQNAKELDDAIVPWPHTRKVSFLSQQKSVRTTNGTSATITLASRPWRSRTCSELRRRRWSGRST